MLFKNYKYSAGHSNPWSFCPDFLFYILYLHLTIFCFGISIHLSLTLIFTALSHLSLYLIRNWPVLGQFLNFITNYYYFYSSLLVHSCEPVEEENKNC
jgi:hypothetical protein